MRLSSVAAEGGDYAEAVFLLDRIVAQFPGSPRVPALILEQGRLLTLMGETEQAREKYQYILKVTEWRGPPHARALLQTGEAFMADGEYAKAHGFFERTFLGYPHLAEWSARAYLADAEALIGMGAPEDAIRTLQEGSEEMAETAPEEILAEIRAKLAELRSS
jgi:tetratricopeptide (TPR) repeat protein